MSTPRCPDCLHAWAVHKGDCTVDGCLCDGMAAFRPQQPVKAYGTVTLICRDDKIIQVSTAWPEPVARHLADGLAGKHGQARYESSWQYFIGRLERIIGQGVTGEWCGLGEPPPT